MHMLVPCMTATLVQPPSALGSEQLVEIGLVLSIALAPACGLVPNTARPAESEQVPRTARTAESEPVNIATQSTARFAELEPAPFFAVPTRSSDSLG